MSLHPTSAGSCTPDRFLEVGYQRLYADDSAGAGRAFRMAVAADPTNAEAHGALAEVLDAEPADAARVFGRALRLDPGRWSWRLGRAEALAAAGDDRALSVFQDLVAERPDAAAVRRGHGRALARAGRTAEAAEELREALVLRPGDRDVLAELAELLMTGGDALAAVELLTPALRRLDGDAGLHRLLGHAWAELREPAKALAALRHAQEIEPDDRTAALVAALEGGEGADLSAAYVRALFDRYADRFDSDLVGKLDYAAPRILRAAIDRVCGPLQGMRALDLGCGTGLMGVELRPLCAHLAGVDLSPRMVEKARGRGLYDALSVGDIVDAMVEPARWDLLVAADVLVYIGDLAPVFAAAATALAPGGRFAATVERLEGDGFALGPARRYAHSVAYLKETAAAAGLGVLLLEECSPRREKQAPVPGLVFVLGKA
ncbi:methyltransferase [Azospirillum sp.]|uniref:methyltransferase n=1 Tax=Azospirillum sp. TaxID=34012 RepID=UPI003D745F92